MAMQVLNIKHFILIKISYTISCNAAVTMVTMAPVYAWHRAKSWMAILKQLVINTT